MPVIDARLPVNIETGAVGGPLFKTTVLVSASGIEQRIPEFDVSRGEWDIGYGIRGDDDLAVVIAFFRAMMGKAYSWKFKDWSDYTATTQNFGTGNGTTTDFQLKKTYSALNDALSPVQSYIRNIYVPRSSGLTVFDNASPVSGSDYDLEAGGIISFDTPPITGHALTWTGEFDCAVRFDIDKLPVSVMTPDVGMIRGIRIVEVLDSIA
jgi:uncharacterized protein (TIGR02217 family)